MKCKYCENNERMPNRSMCNVCYRQLKYIQSPDKYTKDTVARAHIYWKATFPSYRQVLLKNSNRHLLDTTDEQLATWSDDKLNKIVAKLALDRTISTEEIETLKDRYNV